MSSLRSLGTWNLRKRSKIFVRVRFAPRTIIIQNTFSIIAQPADLQQWLLTMVSQTDEIFRYS